MELKNKIFRHYKGKLYRLLDIVRHSESLEELVLYEALYENELGKFWVRPKEMFFGDVIVNGKKLKRFDQLTSKPRPD